MKSVLIVSHALEIGGAERALLAMLELFDYSRYTVDLFLMRQTGDLMNLLPEQVHLLPEKRPYTGLAVPMASILKRGMFRVAAGRLEAKVKARQYCKRNNLRAENGVELEYSHKYTVSAMPMISEKTYDLVISFLTPHYFAAQKTKARQKIAWIHTDYSYVDIDVESERSMWDQYDRIISISEECTKGFLSKFPELASKVMLVENLISPTFLRKQSQLETDVVSREMPKDGTWNLLSVGRFTYAKNFDNVPDICRRILSQGIPIRWYLIGFGGQEEKIRDKIRQNGVQNQVILLGKKNNPYPYMAACDLYVQPSRYEGKCVAVREAQILGKPVVITRYATSASQLRDRIDGKIVPMDNQGCADGIVSVLRDQKTRNALEQNCLAEDYSNVAELEKIYRLIEK